MQNVAEAVLRVFHKYGDYEHRQRNRMKFVVKQLGWETFRAKVMEELEAFVAAGGAPPQAHGRAAEAAGCAPTGSRTPAPSVSAVAAAAVTPVVGPGIMPGSVKLQTVDDPFVRWGQTNVMPAEAGRLLPL
jgi:sulfite reductase (NADPH) hemoprotein beta-component